jgi:alkanesulfonate monooxygenase SsuD/methylene tetrahydromethanopterin reductase-like flavin-dependent oxidoreductase (luciferase family)
MELGLHLSQDGIEYKEILNIAVEAERAGLDSFWVLDHLHASPKPDGQHMLECWTLLSALATATTRIRLGALVLNINNRNPSLVAKMATTLDQISGGRLEFGVGAGGTNRAEQQRDLGYEYEFSAYGVSFPMRPSIRIEKLDEGLEIMKRMWTQEKATFQGKYYSVIDAICLPKPIQKPHPPIWIGGIGGSKIMRVIAKHANGWNMMRSSTLEDYVRGIKLLKEACARIGRNSDEIKISIGVTGSIVECQEKLYEFARQGLDFAILRLPRNKEIEYLRDLDQTYDT